MNGGSSGAVSIDLGDGSGGFAAPTTAGAGSYPGAVAVGDFNNDGNEDLAMANVSGVGNGPEPLAGNLLQNGGFEGQDAIREPTKPAQPIAGWQTPTSFRPCRSPRKLRHLKLGRHTFLAEAVDQAGNVDPTPARWRWRVVRRSR